MTFACKGKPAKNFESPIWHIDLAANVGDDGEEIQRSYTPYSTAEEYKKAPNKTYFCWKCCAMLWWFDEFLNTFLILIKFLN